jgi:hypothetical protein
MSPRSRATTDMVLAARRYLSVPVYITHAHDTELLEVA